MELRKHLVPEFIFGDNALNLVGRYASNLCARKVLIVTDSGIIKAGWLDCVISSLKEENINYLIFDEVTQNPKDYEVMKGAELFKSKGCDVIVGIGGGSPMDCAKGIGIVSSNRLDILEFEGVDKVKIPIPPLICIPTTAGTSADISQFAIITDTQKAKKMAIISKTVVPDVSLIDAITTTTMDYNTTAATGMDALVHAIEAYVSNASSPLTDLYAQEAIRLIYSNLKKTLDEPLNLDYRNNMMQGSLLAGMAFSNASLGLVHAMAHSLGGLKDLLHGECNALLLEQSILFNFESSPEKYARILEITGGQSNSLSPEEIKLKLYQTISELRNIVGIDFTLHQMGIQRHELKQLAENAFYDACLATNPGKISVEQIEGLYERIF
jgi:alcohol dehydrogenase